ncbi:DNA repair exonuclease [uncultured Desulfovibrio sp.]|uniref:metallophosphoesterase family protein n=1 Tax=uncultured Desulfovibrio sp. TaxID=167968 RepID=UPI00272A5803|nr:DNA repair exonuclease [uncultured Desulfovibrio sp.]
MDAIRYIHAADLHLDTPFQGLSRETAQGGHLARLLHDATFTALERLFRLCESEKPDFLVLAGDIYNQENYSVKAQLRLRDGCERLNRLGIRVFLAHGNHDPLDSRLNAVEWPDNVTVFGPEPERHLLEKDGRPLAVVHGISHAKAREGRNLARFFQRDTRYDCFQLGVLHCTVEGESKADRYAPCCLDDLKSPGLDAGALGHVHERRVLSEEPFIAYPGNAQGLHVNEPGPRGCLLVTAAPRGGSYVCDAAFQLLGPVQWAKLELDLDGVSHLDEVERRLNQCLEDAAQAADPACEAIMARITLSGRTTLDAMLHDAASQEDLAERLRHLSSGMPGVWLKDLRVETRPLTELSEYLQREDLLGEAVRLTGRMRESREALQEIAGPALAPLFEHKRLRKALTPPDESQMQALLHEAERLCVELLEVR